MGSFLRKLNRHVRKVVELRKLARSTKSVSERETALALANVLVSKYKLDEADLVQAERVAATQTSEDVTVLLEGELARTLWSMGAAEAVANVHNLIRYKKNGPPPIVFVLGAEETRVLCQSDVEAVIHAMREKALPHSAAQYHHLSFLEGMAWGFGSTVENARKTLLAKAGTMMVRPSKLVAPEPEAEDDGPTQVPPDGPPQPIIRPDPKLLPNLDMRRRGEIEGVALAYKYIAARMDKTGRTIGLALKWKR